MHPSQVLVDERNLVRSELKVTTRDTTGLYECNDNNIITPMIMTSAGLIVENATDNDMTAQGNHNQHSFTSDNIHVQFHSHDTTSLLKSKAAVSPPGATGG